MANDLRVGIVADASQMTSEFDRGAAKVEEFSNRTQKAIDSYNAIAARGAAAQKTLGAAFDQATASGKSFTEAMESAAAAVGSVSAASETAATAVGATANQAERAGGAVGQMGNQFAATRGAVQLLEGRLPIRAMERFIAQSSVIGPLLQTAFPVIGAIALGEVLVDMGRKVYDLYEKYISLDAAAEQFGETVEKIRQRDIVDVRSIEDANLRVKELNESADHLLTTAQQMHSTGFGDALRGFLSGGVAGGAAGLADLITARQLADEGYQKKLQGNEIDIKSLELNHQLAVEKIEAAHAGDAALDPLQRINAQEEKRIALIREQQQFARERDQALRNPVSAQSGDALANLQIQAAQREASAERANIRPGTPEGYDAARRKLLGGPKAVGPGEALSSETERRIKEVQEEQKRDNEESARVMQEANRAVAEMQHKADEDHLATVRETAEEQIRAADASYQQTSQSAGVAQRSGQISEPQKIAILQAAVAQRERIEAEAQRAIIATYESGTEQYQRAQDKLTDIERRAEQQRAQLAQQNAAHTQSVYTGLFNGIESKLQGVTNAWLTGSETMTRAWTQMADQIAIAVIDSLVKIAAQELIGLALHKTIGADERLDDAKTAAAGTWKALAGIPYIGPFIAPPAAAAAFAAVAAFDTGTDYVPKTGMAVIHQGERILNTQQNEQITKAFSSGGGQGGDTHFHYSPNISGIDGASVAGMARQHGSVFMRQAYRQQRLSGRAQ